MPPSIKRQCILQHLIHTSVHSPLFVIRGLCPCCIVVSTLCFAYIFSSSTYLYLLPLMPLDSTKGQCYTWSEKRPGCLNSFENHGYCYLWQKSHFLPIAANGFSVGLVWLLEKGVDYLTVNLCTCMNAVTIGMYVYMHAVLTFSGNPCDTSNSLDGGSLGWPVLSIAALQVWWVVGRHIHNYSWLA